MKQTNSKKPQSKKKGPKKKDDAFETMLNKKDYTNQVGSSTPRGENSKNKTPEEKKAEAFAEFQKRYVGRPTKYESRFCEMLIFHFSQGLSFESFAGEIFVDVQTLYNWTKQHKEFFEAKALGESQSLSIWEKTGGPGSAFLGSGFNTGLWVHNMKCRFKKFGWNPRVGEGESDDRTGFDTGDDADE